MCEVPGPPTTQGLLDLEKLLAEGSDVRRGGKGTAVFAFFCPAPPRLSLLSGLLTALSAEVHSKNVCRGYIRLRYLW